MNNKKDTIREYLLECQDGFMFKALDLAADINTKHENPPASMAAVHSKDVSNVTNELLKSAALSRTKNGKEFEYTVDGNLMSIYFSKNPILDKPAKSWKGKTEDDISDSPPTTRRPNRSPLVRAIDDEIAAYKGESKKLENKIKKLETLRKEFVQ